MKGIALFIGLLCSVCAMSAQTTLNCVYQEKYIKDANHPDKLVYDEHVLVISENRSAYYSRYARIRNEIKDSLLKQGMSAMKLLLYYKRSPEVGSWKSINISQRMAIICIMARISNFSVFKKNSRK